MSGEVCPKCGDLGYVLVRDGRWQVARPCPRCKRPKPAKVSGRRLGRPKKIPPGHEACIVCGGSGRGDRSEKGEDCTACGGVGYYPVAYR